MAISDIFVGRANEISQFNEILKDPGGQVILIVGHQGMGKTLLMDHLEKLAERFSNVKSIRYRVLPSETPETIMETILTDVQNASQKAAGFFDLRGQVTKIKALLDALKIGALIDALLRRPGLRMHEKFLATLKLLSNRMSVDGRFIIFVDPDPYLSTGSVSAYRAIAEGLPAKIKLVIAQRPDDEIINDHDFMALPNLVRIPYERLRPLDEKALQEFVDRASPAMNFPQEIVLKAMEQYNGHPYGVAAALELLADGIPIANLPSDPTQKKVATSQWQHVREKGPDAVSLFRAYAVLEVPVPHDVVTQVSNITSESYSSLTGNNYLASLVRKEGDGGIIYHSILSNHVLNDLSVNDARPYHERACRVYRARLSADIKPDELSALRLPIHERFAHGDVSFVECFLQECSKPLRTLGLLEDFIRLSNIALKLSMPDEKRASILDNLGNVYRVRGELEKAEEMHKKSLEINERLERFDGVSSNYNNLGIISRIRGELQKAEEMQKKSLEINERLGKLEAMANNYGNLCTIYGSRGELEKAEEMQIKSLEINKRLKRLGGIAIDYSQLGIIYKNRGELQKAEEMHYKSLEINERLGRLEGMADNYGNLGIVYLNRGDLAKAEEMHKKSLEIEERLGRLEGMAKDYSNLGDVYKKLGQLDKAEEMYRKSLAIFQEINLTEAEKVTERLRKLHDKDNQ
jgi:tetratricopeptide (TPR) repeat protein/energy-coupling factor transporter ATP-binding protein EcfA2